MFRSVPLTELSANYSKKFFQDVHSGPIRWITKWFFKIWIFYSRNFHFKLGFGVFFENYSMCMLSIRGNDFIAHWAYEETISLHTEHTPNEFSRMLSQRKNLNSFYMYSYAEHTGKWFYRTLSIRGNYLNAGRAYEEMISSLTEHTQKCLLKVKYLGRIEYDFQNSGVTGPWVN